MKRVFLIMLLLIGATNITWAYSGGDGTKDDPYQIANTDDLIELSKRLVDWNKHFILTDDIIFPEDETTVNWNGDGAINWNGEDSLGFSPIGTQIEMPFTGSFNGNDKIIQNLYINRKYDDHVGLFGETDGAEILNLGVVDCDVFAFTVVGGLVGFNTSTNIKNCYTSGLIESKDSNPYSNVGGLIGLNRYSYIENCYSMAEVIGIEKVGGLIGSNYSYSTVSNSYADCIIKSNYEVGGLVGDNNCSSIEYCHSSSTINEFRNEKHFITSSSCFGGLVGINSNHAIVKNSYSTSDIILNSERCNGIGGVIGANHRAVVSNCYSTGDIRAEGIEDIAYIGGFCGSVSNSMIEYCYSLSSIDYHADFDFYFIGDNREGNTFINNYFDSEKSNQILDSAASAQPKTTAEMKVQPTFDNWHFKNIWDIDEAVNNGYPYLRDEFIPVEQKDDVYLIATSYDLYWLSLTPSVWDKDFRLIADIDCNGDADWAIKNFYPIGKRIWAFTGTFDGQGHIISNLKINFPAQSNIALFGYVKNAKFENLGIVDCGITGDFFVGSLIGRGFHETVINNCYSTGQVNGGQQIGGLVGGLYGGTESGKTLTPQMKYCYSECKIQGGSMAGGLIGDNSSIIENCYATGDVTGEGTLGGFVGDNAAAVKRCFSTGNVKGVNSVGGFVGADHSESSISISYCTGNVDGEVHVGGFIGMSWEGSVRNSYSRGDVTRTAGNDSTISAFCGYSLQSYLFYCYATGNVYCDEREDKGFLGGVFISVSASKNFFDSEASNQKTDSLASATPKSTAEMKTKSTFTDEGWDFKYLWKIDGVTNDGYPFFDIEVLGIANEEINSDIEINIYPNPAKNKINLSSEYIITSVKIFDINGSLIKTSNATSINIEDLNSACYFILVETTDGFASTKFIKK